MKTKVLKYLYIIASVAFVFALAKYLLLEGELNAQFFIFELLSYMLFLLLLFKTDMYTRESIKYIDNLKIEHAEEKEKLINEISELKDQINEIEISKNRHKKSKNFLESVINKLNKDLAKCKNEHDFSNKLLLSLSSNFEIGIGLCYILDKRSKKYNLKSTYGVEDDVEFSAIDSNDGIHAQAISSREVIIINEIDENYINIESATGASKPNHIYLLPIYNDNETIGLMELASFKKLGVEKFWEEINKNLISKISF